MLRASPTSLSVILLSLCAEGATLCAASPAYAGDEGLGANLIAMGSVGAAASRDNAAISVNPGLLALHARYDIQGQAQYGPYKGLHWGVSGMDARTSKILALGIAYKGDSSNPPLAEVDMPGWWEPDTEIPNRKRYHDVAASFGVPLLDRRLSLGLGGNFSYFDHDRQGDGWTLDGHAGVGIKPVEPLVFGLSLRNFVHTRLDRPLAVRGGVRFAPSVVALEANVEWKDTDTVGMPLWFGAGADLPVPVAEGQLHIRAGYNREASAGVNSLSAGIGFEERGAVIEYGLSVPVIGDLSFEDTIHALQIRFSTAPEGAPPL